MGRFEGKVAIVTGASSGIGAATAIALAREGASVVICGRDAKRLADTAKACSDAGAKVLEIVSDLGKFENLEPIITKSVERFSQIDILVNNAGYGLVGLIEDLKPEDYQARFDVNLRAPVFLCKYALPHLKKTKGCVVNVSSMASISSTPNYVVYCMTKAAMDHFTKGFAAETAQFGIRVNSICPGVVKTRIFKPLAHDVETADQLFEDIAKATQPFGMISRDAIADSILYLCSATHSTGTQLVVDSGFLLANTP